MKFQIDEQFLINCFRDFVETPSPVGYRVKLLPVLERYAAMFGYTVTYDNRGTGYITLDGEDNSKTVLMSAHCDTIGLMVRRVEANGMIRTQRVGGINHANIEGESVIVHTRDGREYTGLLACQSHSVHVFDDARTLERGEATTIVLLDEDVHSKAEVNALGIRNGDYISIEPRMEYTKNGYLKSRFVDDKALVACVFAMLKYMQENNLKPKYRTILAFTFHEEIGGGGPWVPEEVSEYIALDIALVGPDYDGHDHGVTIIAKDMKTTYSYELVNRMIDYAEKADCDYAVDIYHHYSTDAAAAFMSCNNLQIAAFGMPTYCSHGRERAHIEGIRNTCNLMLAYALDI